jgi:hypothetical protein
MLSFVKAIDFHQVKYRTKNSTNRVKKKDGKLTNLVGKNGDSYTCSIKAISLRKIECRGIYDQYATSIASIFKSMSRCTTLLGPVVGPTRCNLVFQYICGIITMATETGDECGMHPTDDRMAVDATIRIYLSSNRSRCTHNHG